MALISVDLLGGTTEIISEDTGAADGDTIGITALSGNSELIVDGVDVTMESLAGVTAGSTLTYTAQNDANLTIDAGLLNVGALNTINFNVVDTSDISLNASSISTLNGTNDYNVDFTNSDGGSFTFTKPAVSLLDGYSFTVTGMGAGDQLTLLNANGSQASWSVGGYSDGVLTLTNGNILTGQTSVEIPMTQAEYDEFAANQDEFLSGGSFTFVCFAEGTMIKTPEGEVAVETLKMGDLITTAEGKTVPVKWIGRQTARSRGLVDQAVRISQGALGENMPNQDLVVTACHGMIVDGLIIQANALVNGESIDYVPASELPRKVTYYHVETEHHDVILANGAPAETFVDNVTRQYFDNYAEYEALFGAEGRVVEMEMPRAKSVRQVPRRIREMLADRARMLGFAAARKAA